MSKYFGKSGIDIIADERKTILDDGYTIDKDLKFKDNELVRASVCYLRRPFYASHIQTGQNYPTDFPFSPIKWKPSIDDRIKELAKAGALIASEIDKLQKISNETN